jgi:hypothetical protein
MTGNEMLSTLGLRLEDPQESSFTQAAKIDALNIAQISVVNLVNNAYLVELQAIQTATAMTAGALAFANMTTAPIRNGVVAVKDSDGKWATLIEPSDLKRLENTYLAGSVANPVAYVFGEKIYVEGISATDNIVVWYIRAPLKFTSGNAVTNVSQVLTAECELNPALHEIVVDLAESQLWKMDAKSDRATSAQSNAGTMIEALNARYQGEAPSGIGTKGRS